MSIGSLETEADLRRFIEKELEHRRVQPGELADGIRIPPGLFFATGRSAAPTGFLMCDGAAVSRTTYADLFAAISTAYGVGDGSTTFNVPNFNGGTGRMPYGKGARALGALAGGEASNMPSHSHGGATGNANIDHQHGLTLTSIPSGGGPAISSMHPFGLNDSGTSGMFSNNPHGHSIAAEGAGGAADNLPPIIVCNFIVSL